MATTATIKSNIPAKHNLIASTVVRRNACGMVFLIDSDLQIRMTWQVPGCSKLSACIAGGGWARLLAAAPLHQLEIFQGFVAGIGIFYKLTLLNDPPRPLSNRNSGRWRHRQSPALPNSFFSCGRKTDGGNDWIANH
ncbi:MAG: hypothetical protein WA924_03905 [Burkholderiaceae bacterium]